MTGTKIFFGLIFLIMFIVSMGWIIGDILSIIRFGLRELSGLGIVAGFIGVFISFWGFGGLCFEDNK